MYSRVGWAWGPGVPRGSGGMPCHPAKPLVLLGLDHFGGPADVLSLTQVGDVVPMQPGEWQPCVLALVGGSATGFG